MDFLENAGRHASDVVSQNQAGLMGDFTPAGLQKAMALMANPLTPTSFEVKDLGNNEVEISYINDTTTRVIWSKWVDTGDKWQIEDLAER
jgi:hypothetical protein